MRQAGGAGHIWVVSRRKIKPQLNEATAR